MNETIKLAEGTWITAELRVIGELGEGGMGRVYLAHDQVLDRKVAVKVLSPPRPDDDPDQTDQGVRAVREARAVARVVHANVATVYRLGTFEDRPFIEMEWVDGPSLRDLVAAERLPDASARRRWLMAIAEAIQHAHDCGVIHCDLKPENILIGDLASGRGRIKLVDFGLARGRDLRHRSPTQAMGTLAYLPPEAGLEPPSPAGDQYSFTMLAAELLTGERPLAGDAGPIVDRHRLLPLRAREVLVRGLRERPADRFPNVSALAEALERALVTLPEPSMEPPPGEPPTLRRLRKASQLTPDWIAGLSRDDMRTLLLALITLAPPDHPGLVERLVGDLDDHPIMSELRQDWIDGDLGQWQLRDRGLATVILHRLRDRAVAALRVALAHALEGGRDVGAWVREDVARLYAAAGQPAEAARLVLAGARLTVSARGRDQGLQRAVALLSAPTHLEAWLSALVERLEWTLRCGWQTVAGGALTLAKGLAAERGWRPGESLSMRLLVAEATLRTLAGRPAGALSLLERVPDGPSLQSEPPTWRLTALAERARALLALDQVEDASACIGPALGAIDDDQAADPARVQAAGRVLGVGARILLHAQQPEAAASLATRRLCLELDRGDELASAVALVALGQLHLAAGDPDAASSSAEEADELLRPVGAVGIAGEAELLQARCDLASGRPLSAMRRAQNALWLWRGQGAAGPYMRALRCMVEICSAAGDEPGVWHHRAELDASRRAGYRPT